jgi:3-deoxy-D-manno-octulosonic-acid transferase
MHVLYSFLATLAVILLLPWFWWKGRRQGKYFRSLRERLGRLSPEISAAAAGREGAIWVHAVSVGELLAGLPLVRALRARYPQRPIFLSTTTDTAQALARSNSTPVDGVFYFPLDWAFAVRRVLRALRPSLVVILETEIWPNFLRQCRRAGVPVVFVNGRISERSFRGYRLANRLFFGFAARALRDAAQFLMQSAADAERLRALGAPPGRVEATGNLKYDFTPRADSPFAQWLESEVANGRRRPLIVAGSVIAHEEPHVLIAFGILQGQFRDALLLLAPRKPERFAAAAAHIEESQRAFVRRSALDLSRPLPEGASVVLLDSVGELAAVYRLADAVFVGGSLVPGGGHNILEPAAFGKPPVFGPHMDNFREIAAQFLSAGAGIKVASPEDLGVAWIELVQDAEKRERMGGAARQIVEANRGATSRSLERIAEILDRGAFPAAPSAQ